MAERGKPSIESLGIDPDAQSWIRSGSASGDGGFEVAFVDEWVLLRVAGDPQGLVLVYDHLEWECFLDGAKSGEFDNAAAEAL